MKQFQKKYINNFFYKDRNLNYILQLYKRKKYNK